LDKAIVIGVGPLDGLGGALCKRFAAEGLHVFVAGRTEAKLKAVGAEIERAGGRATPVVADATSEAQVQGLFETAAETGDGQLSLAIYNTGNNTPGRIAEMEADYFEQSWRVCCFGGFLFGREAIRRMRGNGGVLLFTGASASMRGRANFGAFNSSKGALRNLAQAMAKEYAEEGVHVGHVVIDGPIGGEKIRKGYPEYAEQKGEAGMMSLEGLADAFVFLYRQPPRAWSFEVDVRTSLEKW
jgi:NAD(P)-dependent dehydrogenase (short-subunit alcohol dehydrogenase family)